jgi:hypothetical protein
MDIGRGCPIDTIVRTITNWTRSSSYNKYTHRPVCWRLYPLMDVPACHPCSAGTVYPVLSYSAKMKPPAPTRSKHQQMTTSRQQHQNTGSGHNHHCSQHCHLQRNLSPPPPPLSPTFTTSRQRKQFIDWALPYCNTSCNTPWRTPVPVMVGMRG